MLLMTQDHSRAYQGNPGTICSLWKSISYVEITAICRDRTKIYILQRVVKYDHREVIFHMLQAMVWDGIDVRNFSKRGKSWSYLES